MYELKLGKHPFNSVFESITDGDIFSLFKSCFNRHKEGDHHVFVEGFLSGSPVKLTDNTIDTLCSFDTQKELNEFLEGKKLSLRLNNIHIASAELSTYVREVFKSEGKSLSCNLYFTPQSGQRCLKLHSDKQISHVLQLRGSKKWCFPLTDDEQFIESFDPLRINTLAGPKDKTVELRPGQLLEFPQGLAHKADVIGEEGSIHITFADRLLLKDDVFNAVLSELKTKLQHESSPTEALKTEEDYRIIQNHIESVLKNIEVKNLITKSQQDNERKKLMNLKVGRGSRSKDSLSL